MNRLRAVVLFLQQHHGAISLRSIAKKFGELPPQQRVAPLRTKRHQALSSVASVGRESRAIFASNVEKLMGFSSKSSQPYVFATSASIST